MVMHYKQFTFVIEFCNSPVPAFLKSNQFFLEISFSLLQVAQTIIDCILYTFVKTSREEITKSYIESKE